MSRPFQFGLMTFDVSTRTRFSANGESISRTCQDGPERG
jgi:hypothetical protein